MQSSLAGDATILVRNEPYCSWRLKPVQGQDGKWWTMVAYFEDEKLSRVLLTFSDRETDQGWENWSEEVELGKKELYSTVLTKWLGDDRQFSWGEVDTTYDEKSGSSSIMIHY